MKKRATLTILAAYVIIMAYCVSLLAEQPSPNLPGRWVLRTEYGQNQYLDISEEGILTFTDGAAATEASYRITGTDTLNVRYSSSLLSAADAELTYALEDDQLILNGLTYDRITE